MLFYSKRIQLGNGHILLWLMAVKHELEGCCMYTHDRLVTFDSDKALWLPMVSTIMKLQIKLRNWPIRTESIVKHEISQIWPLYAWKFCFWEKAENTWEKGLYPIGSPICCMSLDKHPSPNNTSMSKQIKSKSICLREILQIPTYTWSANIVCGLFGGRCVVVCLFFLMTNSDDR